LVSPQLQIDERSIRKDFLQRIRDKSSSVKIVPRLKISKDDFEIYQKLQDYDGIQELAALLILLLRQGDSEIQFDGILIDYEVLSFPSKQFESSANILHYLHQSLSIQNKLLLLHVNVIPVFVPIF